MFNVLAYGYWTKVSLSWAKYLAARAVNGKNRAKLLVNINERGVAICDAGEYSPCIRIE